jgi:2,4-dienoyl-CoA reductase-like NADH-dependent reductase (Old Yellow Enzyme family)
MCQYSAIDGFAGDWHLVHLGSRAAGGMGLVCVEATAVSPEGRITPGDLGLWHDDHIEGLRRITDFIRSQGAVPAIQLAHSGRKGSRARPWDGGAVLRERSEGPGSRDAESDVWDAAWTVVGPSPLPWETGDPMPMALDGAGLRRIVEAFRSAAERALQAGFEVVEIHAAHGYLLHSFLSPLTNHRDDAYGGSFEGRTRVLREVAEAVREVWPERLPLLCRLSVTDWMEWTGEPSWTLEQSIELARQLHHLGVDMMDCSSGGLVPEQRIPGGAGYQTPFAAHIRQETGIPTIAVGLVTQPAQADHIIRTGQADLVAIGRQLLRDPFFGLRAAHETHQKADWPNPYLRAPF